MEKRNFVRIESDFVVWYQTIDEDDVSFGKPKSKNVSAGGIRLEMEDTEKVGSNLRIKFKIPQYPKEIEAKGKVVWVKRIETNKFEIGIEFSNINREDMEAINKFAAV